MEHAGRNYIIITQFIAYVLNFIHLFLKIGSLILRFSEKQKMRRCLEDFLIEEWRSSSEILQMNSKRDLPCDICQFN